MSKIFLVFYFFILGLSSVNAQSFSSLIETPSFMSAVNKGQLPPLKDRIPDNPYLVGQNDEKFEPGVHGGELKLLMGRKKDTRQMVVYGYSRLVGYDKKFNLVPDILEKFEVSEGRVFTFYIRKGHKWSDGHPFTSEDFRYYFEDVALNKDIANESLPVVMLVDGKPPKFEILDKYRVRYTWQKSNPYLLPRLAGARPIYLYRPSHYLKNFHSKYTPIDKLQKQAKQAKKRNWVALHYIVSQQYKNMNPDLPSLQPWVLVTRPPAKRFVFKRNPFFHKLDLNGRQLPYINKIKMHITSSKLIPLKTGSGETDLQSRGLNFTNYTLLKKSEKKFGYTTRLWRTAKGARWAIYPNLNARDSEWRGIFRDVRFRRALSLGINRYEINQVFYYGLSRETNNSLLRESPLFNKEYSSRWIKFNLVAANKLLDEIGLEKRNDDGIRLLPSGKPMEITVVFSTEENEPADILELVSDTWKKIGIKLLSKPLNREVMRNRIFSGNALMSMWSGLENGIANAEASPQELAPTSQQQLQWPMWGQYVETSGKSGEPADMDVPKKLLALSLLWQTAETTELKRQIWGQMLDLYTNNVFSIGIISSVPQVVVVNSSLKNIPNEGIYNWDPGAHFGIYRPDTFWFKDYVSHDREKK